MADLKNIDYDALVDVYIRDLKSLVESLFRMIGNDAIENLPDNSRRYNDSTDKFERYSKSSGSWSPFDFHTAIDAHIASKALHSPIPAPAILIWPTIFLPDPNIYGEWMFCHGQALSRIDYAWLFNTGPHPISTAYGVGDGSTTFNLPDFRLYSPIGMGANALLDALGKKTGSLSHTHTQTDHAHTIGAHTHGMGNHTHALPAHTHTVPAHTHGVPPHFHNVNGNGADISINATSGAHLHGIPSRDASTLSPTQDYVAKQGNGTIGQFNTINDGSSNHGHTNASFDGRVGNVNSTRDGDVTNASEASSVLTSGSGGSGVTGVPGNNNTDANTAYITGIANGGQSGAANGPLMAVNFIIKVRP